MYLPLGVDNRTTDGVDCDDTCDDTSLGGVSTSKCKYITFMPSHTVLAMILCAKY